MGTVKSYLLGLLAVLGVLLGVYRYGKKVEADESAIADLENYVETKKRIEDVEASPDRDAAIERMRSRGWL